MILASGQQFHDLTLLKHCGSGAYGEVWLCRDVTGKKLALKIIPKSKVAGELKGISILRQNAPNHPNLLPIYHAAENEEYFYYTMEPADNAAGDSDHYTPDTLANRIQAKGRLEAGEVIHVAEDILAGLTALHDAGMVHRDIKPANILFVHGRAVIADMGLVSVDTSSLSLAGTMGFIPPEVRSGSSSPASCGKNGDLYAFGMVLYCALTGNSPEDFPRLPEGVLSSPQARRMNHLICHVCEPRKTDRISSAKKIHKGLNRISKLAFQPIRWHENLMPTKRMFHFWIYFLVTIGVILGTAVLAHSSGYTPKWNKIPMELPETKLYCHSRFPITMKIPRTWEVLDKETMNKIVDAISLSENKDGVQFSPEFKKLYKDAVANGMEMIICGFDTEFSDNLTVSMLEIDRDDITSMTDSELKVAYRALLPSNEKNPPEIFHITRTKWKELQVIQIEYSILPNVLSRACIFLLPHTAYIFTLSAKKERFQKYTAEFDAMLKSVEFPKHL